MQVRFLLRAPSEGSRAIERPSSLARDRPSVGPLLCQEVIRDLAWLRSQQVETVRVEICDVARLPRDWGVALDAFEASDWARDAFGQEFCRTYSLIKRYEYEKFRRTVSSSERELYIEFL